MSAEQELTIGDLQGIVYQWNHDRPSMLDHNLIPGSLETNIALESAEVLETYKLRNGMDEVEYREKLGGEMADVMWYLLLLAEIQGIDLNEEIMVKLAINTGKYRPEDFQGTRDDFPKQYLAIKKKLGERK